ncbi:hypothetical protein [Fodinicola acaciae]|uniref:hypothetical protein n=1 Tax=Fodinicola acaciae TaxID=2681555 RepID=UPI0013D76727|nr:hypothetical protein [Fodinicola acaciae]
MSGFIAVSCERCALSLDKLRDTVRGCPHGVLVRAGCLLGRTYCGSAQRSDGEVVMVQPCGTDHRPHGSAALLGPLEQDDVAVVCDWLRDGMSTGLPDRLFASSRHRLN